MRPYARLGLVLAALLSLAALDPAPLAPLAAAHASSCTLTTQYGGFQDCAFSCRPGDLVVIDVQPQRPTSAVGGTATCGGATATCWSLDGVRCYGVSPGPASYHDDGGSCNNEGPRGRYAETVQTCTPQALVPEAPSLGDADDDGLPDGLEALLCGSAASRLAVESTSSSGHACLAPGDYAPPQTRTSVFVPLTGTFWGDEDHDLVPKRYTPSGLRVTLDPLADPPYSAVPDDDAPVAIDPDDHDGQVPVPWGAVDADGDRVPDEAEPTLCFFENQTLPQDGSCDAAAQDYAPPVPIPPFDPYN